MSDTNSRNRVILYWALGVAGLAAFAGGIAGLVIMQKSRGTSEYSSRTIGLSSIAFILLSLLGVTGLLFGILLHPATAKIFRRDQ